ncbi:MAG: sigma-70 family RNA polymerase sigma factor [Oscillatoriales cyanobacterium RM2_1_1]|nr:sigma-70 family RNA polymerase sigma factor [Oscillatoriales cyanobacterium SM2_3_0]NJO44469.1 sigma-70 family RNA polymerase sigma factor [Oscillatoriales cyanobacterium RM2_1_1]
MGRDTIYLRLQQIIAEAQALPPESAERRQKLNQIIRLVTGSGKLWRESVDYYNDALQEMWEYCCQHLEDYDPQRSHVITWFDYHLKKRLRVWRDRHYRDQNRQITPQIFDDSLLDPLDFVSPETQIQPALEIWERTLEWVQADPQHRLCRTCFRRCSQINCQVLFFKRFPHETPWKDIAAEFDLDPAAAKDLPKFYNRKCLPLLRDFGQSQGYLHPP